VPLIHRRVGGIGEGTVVAVSAMHIKLCCSLNLVVEVGYVYVDIVIRGRVSKKC